MEQNQTPQPVSLLPGFVTSPSIKNLAPALVALFSKTNKAFKNKENKYDHYKYANLESVMEAIEDGLEFANIVILQSPKFDPATATVNVFTTLMHESGEYAGQDLTMPVVARINKDKPNDAPTVTATAIGAAITYARKYAIKAALGIPDTDDVDQESQENSNQGPSEIRRKPDPLQPQAPQQRPPVVSMPRSAPQTQRAQQPAVNSNDLVLNAMANTFKPQDKPVVDLPDSVKQEIWVKENKPEIARLLLIEDEKEANVVTANFLLGFCGVVDMKSLQAVPITNKISGMKTLIAMLKENKGEVGAKVIEQVKTEPKACGKAAKELADDLAKSTNP